jgi:hypothetical protein
MCVRVLLLRVVLLLMAYAVALRVKDDCLLGGSLLPTDAAQHNQQ